MSNNIKEVIMTKDIKETDELDKIYNLFLLEAEKPKQCVEKPNYNIRLLGW
jgi:hypothetical protein